MTIFGFIMVIAAFLLLFFGLLKGGEIFVRFGTMLNRDFFKRFFRRL